jgi:hypothetical protein
MRDRRQQPSTDLTDFVIVVDFGQTNFSDSSLKPH